MKKSIFNISKLSLILILGSWFMASCTPSAIDDNQLFLTEDQADELISQGTLLTLQQFKDSFMTEKGNYLSDTTLYRTRATKDGKNYLFSIDTIPTSDKPIYIRGRVTTDDYAGNFYKAMCIQQIVDGEQQALRLSIDAGSVGGLYQLGQEILIRVDGLAIGRYANQPQLCLPSYNNNIYANNAEQKIGWAPGRVPLAIFRARTQCIGKPDVSQLVYDEYESRSSLPYSTYKKHASGMPNWCVSRMCTIQASILSQTVQYPNALLAIQKTIRMPMSLLLLPRI